MGLANWVVGKMVDSFLAQPPEEIAAVFETIISRFWEAATPEETANIARLLFPKLMEVFVNSTTAEQKAEMLRSLLDSEQLQAMTSEMATEMLPDLVAGYLQNMSPEQWQKLMPSPMPGMPGMPGSTPRPKPDAPGQPKRRPPKGPGGMMPW